MQNPVKCSQVLTFSTMWKTLEVHRFLRGFSQGLSQVFSEEKNSQGFSQGFACVLTLWKMPCSQVLTFSTMWKTLKVHRFLKFFTGPFTGFFRGEKLTGFCMGSVLVKNALFTGSQQFHTLWKRCEKHVKLNSSQAFHSIFTCFYPILKGGWAHANLLCLVSSPENWLYSSQDPFWISFVWSSRIYKTFH